MNQWRFLRTQLSLGAVLVVIFTVIMGLPAGCSAFEAVIVFGIPQGIFTYKAFLYRHARAARQILWSFYLGEVMKIIMSIVLMVGFFQYSEVRILPFFMTYCVLVLSAAMAPVLMRRVSYE